MQQPQIAVGICSEPTVSFRFGGIYSTAGVDVVTGSQTAEISPSGLGIMWNGNVYTDIEFTPTSPEGDHFEIDGVTIGVRFHWERKESQRFRGSLRLIVDNGKITVINIIGVEEYLKSVISSEMSATASLSLLRAHAVISRSWLLAQIGKRDITTAETVIRDRGGERIRWWDRSNHELFDVCADDHCQRYQGMNRVATSTAASAVADTRGLVLTHNGELCDTRFSKCCGGVMEVFETCWDDNPKPYLQARRDSTDVNDFPDLSIKENAREWIMSSPTAFCNTADKRVLSQVLNGYDRETPDFYRWTEELTQEKISRLIAERLGRDFGAIIDLQPLTRGKSGRIRELKVKGSKGEITIGKELMIRRALSESHLYSSAFVVERVFGENITAENEVEAVPEKFILHGAGWGHGAGLCQIGAAIMGERGYDYREILSHYYPSTTLTKLY